MCAYLVNDICRKEPGGEDDTGYYNFRSELAGQFQRNYARGPVIDRYRHGKMSYKIDYFCARAFPIIFGAFNIAYWSYYLSQKD